MTTEQLETELNRASDGLLMRSETDAPFEVYLNSTLAAESLTNDEVVKLAGMPAQYPLQVQELDYFFRNMTQVQEGDSEENKEQAQRFRQLQHTLQNLLTNVKVYRIGERTITVFILGETESGHVAGLKTILVET